MGMRYSTSGGGLPAEWLPLNLFLRGFVPRLRLAKCHIEAIGHHHENATNVVLAFLFPESRHKYVDILACIAAFDNM
jgi:hypothetical protein